MEDKLIRSLNITIEKIFNKCILSEELYNRYCKTGVLFILNNTLVSKEIKDFKINNKKDFIINLNEVLELFSLLSKTVKEIDTKVNTNIHELINSEIKKLSIYLISIKYSCTEVEAINRLEYKKHYEELIKNDKELADFEKEMETYFSNEIKSKNLNQFKLKKVKESYLHDIENINYNSSFHVTFQINKNCNFKCTYCYEGLDKLTEIITDNDIPKIVSGLKKLQENLKKDKLPHKLSFSILGGEPTLVPTKRTQMLTKLMMEKLEIHDVILITNNYSAQKTIDFFHPDFPKELIRYQVSYDGGKIQDDYRKDANKKGSKNLLTDEIYKLLNLMDKSSKLSMKATLPMEAFSSVKDAINDYLQFEDVVNDQNGHGSNFSYYSTFDTSSLLMINLRKNFANNQESINSFLLEVENLLKYLVKFEMDRLILGKSLFTRFFKELRYNANDTSCSAGQSLFGLDQLGNARFCHRTEYDNYSNYPKEQGSKLFYGNINNTNFYKIFNESKELITNKKQEVLTDPNNLCRSCKTLTCVKCPMAFTPPDRILDTSVSGDLFTDMYSHGLTLTCIVNNTISKYLYIFDKIINKKVL